MSNDRITRLLNNLRPWDSESLYYDSDTYFKDLIAELDQAKQTIEIESYIFSQDDLGKRVIRSLLNAAKRDINVRIIIDGLGSKEWQLAQVFQLTSAGIKVKIYHPLPWHLSFYQEVKIVKGFFYKFLYLFSRINKRDHRKLYIIDKNAAWTGSLNLSSSHICDDSKNDNWFDCGVKVTGKPVTDLSYTFDEIWRGISLHTLGNKRLPFRTNNNVVKRQRKNLELIRLIRSSKKRIWIISPYLVPSKRIVKALSQARQRGVGVKLLVSKRSDVIVFPLVSTSYYHSLLSSNVEIFEYDGRIIHAKTMMLDEILIVGSSNLNHRSFLHDLELDIILNQPSSLQNSAKKFEQLVDLSSQMTLEKLAKLPWYKHLLGKIIWRLRYWL